MEKKAYSIGIESLVLAESHFSRSHQAGTGVHDHTQCKTVFEIKRSEEVDGRFVVTFGTTVDVMQAELRLATFNITMVAVFYKTTGEVPAGVVETFCRVNGPAIIYPYVREHVWLLSAKGGFAPPIVLQPVSFVALADK